MIVIQFHKVFIKNFKLLPVHIKKKSIELEEIFRENPFHPVLYVKPLKGKLKGLYSFRITREYRIIFIFTSKDEVSFLNVKHRKDIYR